MPLFRILLALLCASLLCGTAEAQRGELHQNFDGPPKSKSFGFPSLLNAEMVAKTAVHVDIWGHADYGLTERTSIGVNIWALAASASGDLSLGFRARNRLYSKHDLASIIDLRYYKFGPFSSFVASSSTSLYRDYGTFTGTAFIAGMSGDFLDSAVELDFVGVAATFERYLIGPLGVSLTAGSLPALSGFFDSDGGSIGASVRPGIKGVYERSVVRGVAQLRLGRWLVGGGAFVPLVSTDAVTPWIELAWTTF